MTWLLVGAGGHAKAIVEALKAAEITISAYVDPLANGWLDAEHIASDAEADRLGEGRMVLGIGGMTAADLRRRLALYQRYRSAGWDAPAVVHPSATVSETAALGEGAIVLARAVIQPGAVLGEGVIVNTGAIVEHDCRIGAGAHIGPAATVLGGCTVGEATMVGAGAIILPGATVPDDSLVPALTRYPT